MMYQAFLSYSHATDVRAGYPPASANGMACHLLARSNIEELVAAAIATRNARINTIVGNGWDVQVKPRQR